jgi:hypothetical protein
MRTLQRRSAMSRQKWYAALFYEDNWSTQLVNGICWRFDAHIRIRSYLVPAVPKMGVAQDQFKP